MELLDTLPHKIQLSLHSHESNAKGELSSYMDEVMTFSTQAAAKGTCMVLRLWNQGGRDRENEEVMRLIEKYIPKPWKDRPDGFRLCDHLYLELTGNSNGLTSKTTSRKGDDNKNKDENRNKDEISEGKDKDETSREKTRAKATTEIGKSSAKHC